MLIFARFPTFWPQADKCYFPLSHEGSECKECLRVRLIITRTEGEGDKKVLWGILWLAPMVHFFYLLPLPSLSISIIPRFVFFYMSKAAAYGLPGISGAKLRPYWNCCSSPPLFIPTATLVSIPIGVSPLDGLAISSTARETISSGV